MNNVDLMPPPPKPVSQSPDRKSMPTIDFATHILHSCHFFCIFGDYTLAPSECNLCMENCINKGKKTYPNEVFDQSAQTKVINEKCIRCDDFDQNHRILSTWAMCSFSGQHTVSRSQGEIATCMKGLYEKYLTIVDAASYVAHVCHRQCFFRENTQTKRVLCLQSCISKDMKTLPKDRQEPLNYVARNKECTTCSKFNIPHIRETILDICNYPHRSRTMGANFRQCRFILASLFTEAGMNKKELEKASKPFEWVS
ncbi:hypothetical protein AX14_003675 [Amanita brunnescens Koide BX004]|nr:hypothetical protein AX14_003675 [Amanita brunnescens Koide BX004]